MMHAASSCGSSSDPARVERDVQLNPRAGVRMSEKQQQLNLRWADEAEAYMNWKIEWQDRGWIWPDNDGPDRYDCKAGILERGWKTLSKEHADDLRETIARIRKWVRQAQQIVEQEKTAATDIDEAALAPGEETKKKRRDKDQRLPSINEFGQPSDGRASIGPENENNLAETASDEQEKAAKRARTTVCRCLSKCIRST